MDEEILEVVFKRPQGKFKVGDRVIGNNSKATIIGIAAGYYRIMYDGHRIGQWVSPVFMQSCKLIS